MEPLTDSTAPVLKGADTLPPMQGSKQPAAIRTVERKATSKTHLKQTANRFAVLNAFVDGSLGGLSRAELATWLILYRDTRNGTAATAQSDIARRAGLSVRAVGRAVGKLIKKGLLTVVYRGGLNRGRSRYRVEPQRNQRSC